MMGRVRRRVTAIVVAGMALVVALAAAPGFTASLDLPGSPAGEGSGTVSGFQVSDIDYVLADDPSVLQAVQFVLDDSSADQVKVRLVRDGGAWYPCHVDGFHVRCETSGSPVAPADVDEFRVVAAD